MIRFKLNSQFLFLFFFLIGEFTVEIISVFPFLLEKYSNIFISFFLRKIFSVYKIFTVHSYTVAIILYFERIIKSYLHGKCVVINSSFKYNKK